MALDRYTLKSKDPKGVLLGFAAFDEKAIRAGLMNWLRRSTGDCLAIRVNEIASGLSATRRESPPESCAYPAGSMRMLSFTAARIRCYSQGSVQSSDRQMPKLQLDLVQFSASREQRARAPA